MAYRFDGATSHIRFAGGDGNIPVGAATVAMLFNSNTTGGGGKQMIHTTAWDLNIRGTTSGLLGLWNGSQDAYDSASDIAFGDWYIAAVTKAAGSAQPRYHIYDLVGWEHRDSATTTGNSGTPLDRITIGSLMPDASGDYFSGDIVCAGISDQVWTDAEVEARLTLNFFDWEAAPFVWLVGFQDLSTVEDAIGSGDETARVGIEIADDPAGWEWLAPSEPGVEPGTLAGVMVGIADALAPIAAEVDGLQVYPYLNSNPTPPSLDIYPGAPFQTGAGFGVGQSQVWFTIRARVSTADQEAAMRLLLRMMDPNDPASVEAAIADTAAVTPEGVSEFREYLEDSASNGRLLGCEWRVSIFL